VLAAIVDIPPNAGYSVVFILIALETMGIPLPGETALIAASLLAHDGRLSIEIVVALAAAAAILGDNVGFMIGRHYGRRIFEKPGPLHAKRLALLRVGEPFFARHGPKAVFLGRWVGGLRIASAWLAGMNKMQWPVFLFWNALGGICWAVGVGLGAYYLGHVFEDIVRTVGLGAAIAAALALVAFFVWRHRRSPAPAPAEPADDPA
jgi:membrane protein DedA with SNARE-associated domain